MAFLDSPDVAPEARIQLLDDSGKLEGEGVEQALESIALEVVVLQEIRQCFAKFLDIPAETILKCFDFNFDGDFCLIIDAYVS